MRRALVLILLALAPGCRRSPPPPPAAAPEIAPATTAGAAPAAAPEAAPAPPARPPPTGEAPAGTAAPVEASPPGAAVTAEPAATRPPAPEAGADEPEDTNIYAWTDERGTIHYGMAGEAPPEKRRAVEGGIVVVQSPSFDSPGSPGEAASARGTVPAPVPAPTVRGERPQLDAQGLPIPETMDDTAHTRALKQATGAQLDPASMERQRAIDSRRMHCVEKDGGTFCSGE